jgi:hypothetical protein
VSRRTYRDDPGSIALKRAFRGRWAEHRRVPRNERAEGEPVPPALAAYLLGRGGHACRLEQRMLLDVGDPTGEEADWLPRSVRDLEQALEALRGVVRDSRYRKLRDILSRCHPALNAPTSTSSVPTPPTPATPGHFPDKKTWQRFGRLAIGAFPPDTVLGALAVLGAVVGGVELGLYERAGMPEEGLGRAEANPLVRAIIRTAISLPEEWARDAPLLLKARGSAPHVATSRSMDWLAQMMPARTRRVVEVDARSPQVELRYNDLVIEIDFSIQKDLMRITPLRPVRVLVEPPALKSDASPTAGRAYRGRPYLGLTLAEERREVQREGYPSTIKFKGNTRLWELLKTFVWSGGAVLNKGDLYRQVWASAGATPDDSTIYWAISKLKSKIRPLGVEIENQKGVGYRLVETSG